LDTKIDNSQAEHWSDIASKLRQISQLLDDCQLTLLLKLHVSDGKALKAIDDIAESSNGMAYLFTPQSEWIGGDSSNPNNFKFTLPHIAR